MEYQLCGLPINCNTFRNYSNCSVLSECMSGCFCSNYYILEDGECTDPTRCSGKLSIVTLILYLQLLVSAICNYQLSIHKTEVYWVFMGSILLLLFHTQSGISTVSLPLIRFAKRGLIHAQFQDTLFIAIC